ncbi:MAG: Peroxisomal membrane signal receptor PTS1 [Peltula sp. TS41687]|nr:MAG: Peroxisomal membrane signal receptor PTS1 [Peltula sp. TS41687]
MSLLGGAECSTAGNPLSQFTKHVHDQQHVPQDRMVERRGKDPLQRMRSDDAVGRQDVVMNGFLHGSNEGLPSPPTTPLGLVRIQRNLERLQGPSVGSQHQTSGWVLEYPPETATSSAMEAAFGPSETHSFAGEDFATVGRLKNGKGKVSSSDHRFSPMTNGFRSPLSNYLQPLPRFAHAPPAVRSQLPHLPAVSMNPDIKDKGRVTELDGEHWETQFAQIDIQDQQYMDAEARAAMEGELDDMDRILGISADASAISDILDNDLVWGREFPLELDFMDGLGTHGGFSRDPQLGDYLFEEDNPFNDVSDPFGEGVRIMEAGGNLSLAALAFEAAVQKSPAHVDAWTMLGNAQAQNEKESPAIRALELAIKLDPGNLSALMGLAVSYTNEGYDSTAYRTLERWLATKYPDVLDPTGLSDPAEFGFTDRQQLHERVTNLFIQAAQLSPGGERMDPDVQVGLGVLFYAAEEYDKAVDCFSSALRSTESGSTTQRQQVHLLWNRLGATLANSGRSEEAIKAYAKALTLKPNFVRARYNLGVSCINVGCYEEAAQHLLGALAMHKVVEQQGRDKAREVMGDHLSDRQIDHLITMQNESTNLYDTLRRVFMQMGRRDLNDQVGPGMDLESLKGDFDF